MLPKPITAALLDLVCGTLEVDGGSMMSRDPLGQRGLLSAAVGNLSYPTDRWLSALDIKL